MCGATFCKERCLHPELFVVLGNNDTAPVANHRTLEYNAWLSKAVDDPEHFFANGFLVTNGRVCPESTTAPRTSAPPTSGTAASMSSPRSYTLTILTFVMILFSFREY